MTPRILAIDTTSEFGSLALARGDDLLEEVSLHAPDGFAHVLFDSLKPLLVRHNLTIREIDCFAAASGPGSFTGVRVGLAAVKGLALACGKPMVAVSNLQAMAAAGEAALRAPILDARRGEVYAAVYDETLCPVLPETVGEFSRWLDSLPETAIEFVAMDFTPFHDALAASRFAGASMRVARRELAASVARIAARQWSSGAAIDPAAADANYVRRSDAELLWKG